MVRPIVPRAVTGRIPNETSHLGGFRQVGADCGHVLVDIPAVIDDASNSSLVPLRPTLVDGRVSKEWGPSLDVVRDDRRRNAQVVGVQTFRTLEASPGSLHLL